MNSIAELIKANREWSQQVKKTDSKFFEKLSKGQSPKYLWIGCSDSRVPASEICGLAPGEVFVHRNIANIVSLTDLSCLSVLQFAIEVLEVRKIIVCGHYCCGGVETVVKDKSYGLIDNWLISIYEVKQKYEKIIQESLAYLKKDKDTYMSKKVQMMCELNALYQSLNLCKTTVVKSAWAKGLNFTVHPAIYDISSGNLYEISSSGAGSKKEMDDIYNKAIEAVKSKYQQQNSR